MTTLENKIKNTIQKMDKIYEFFRKTVGDDITRNFLTTKIILLTPEMSEEKLKQIILNKNKKKKTILKIEQKMNKKPLDSEDRCCARRLHLLCLGKPQCNQILRCEKKKIHQGDFCGIHSKKITNEKLQYRLFKGKLVKYRATYNWERYGRFDKPFEAYTENGNLIWKTTMDNLRGIPWFDIIGGQDRNLSYGEETNTKNTPKHFDPTLCKYRIMCSKTNPETQKPFSTGDFTGFGDTLYTRHCTRVIRQGGDGCYCTVHEKQYNKLITFKKQMLNLLHPAVRVTNQTASTITTDTTTTTTTTTNQSAGAITTDTTTTTTNQTTQGEVTTKNTLDEQQIDTTATTDSHSLSSDQVRDALYWLNVDNTTTITDQTTQGKVTTTNTNTNHSLSDKEKRSRSREEIQRDALYHLNVDTTTTMTYYSSEDSSSSDESIIIIEEDPDQVSY